MTARRPTPAHRRGRWSKHRSRRVARLLRERDQLFLLHEALAEVERARTLEERLAVLESAIQRLGYGRVETHRRLRDAVGANKSSRRISNSACSRRTS